ncbi:unnamed protein product [Didymodactylos carnosus]|uniref:Uncharacterized protein n=1 Tax=Didymodactylos carnosus TaxID=1234261 RepID=A0A814RQE0_9BILA|nr:unnamed protein product [Didymodactylos carnosus]CAF1136538.1 unnamed protein product [Didymodactylos carnosus]CAF3804733.1 unnamed protein product [Didymodactylos carnosus]CAF3900244.1 unnamed protein product [Didymodactylos carnosus]
MGNKSGISTKTCPYCDGKRYYKYYLLCLCHEVIRDPDNSMKMTKYIKISCRQDPSDLVHHDPGGGRVKCFFCKGKGHVDCNKHGYYINHDTKLPRTTRELDEYLVRAVGNGKYLKRWLNDKEWKKRRQNVKNNLTNYKPNIVTSNEYVR